MIGTLPDPPSAPAGRWRRRAANALVYTLAEVPARRAVHTVVVLALAVATAGSVRAQSPEQLEQARTRYDQGLSQEAAGDWAGALATFENVGRVKMTPQVRFHVAHCKEGLGRLVEALGGYRLAEYEAGQAQAAADVLSEISQARAVLEERVPKLILERGEGTASGEIALDGVVLGQTSIGAEVPLDPGSHVVSVKLGDGRHFERTVRLKAGDKQQLHLDVPPALQPESSGPPARAADPTSAAAAPAADAQAEGDSGSALPWVFGGVGVGGLVAAGVFVAMKNSAANELDEGCLGRTCPDTLGGTQRRGERYATLAGVALGVGVVGVGTAVVMLVGRSAGDPPPAHARVRHRATPLAVQVSADLRQPGVSVRGSF